MKKALVLGFLSLLLGMAPFMAVWSQPETEVEPVSVQIGGQKRPFSFYYPYDYQYYNPRPQYEGQSKSCDWVYTNGFWVYSCK